MQLNKIKILFNLEQAIILFHGIPCAHMESKHRSFSYRNMGKSI